MLSIGAGGRSAISTFSVTGTGEFATRLPSVVAMAGAALGVSVIGRRLKSRRTGLCAGLVFAALPIVTQQAHDARPYAMVTGAAVLASYLLIRALAQPRLWPWYGAALAALGLLNMFGMLLVTAHAVVILRAAWLGEGGDGTPEA